MSTNYVSGGISGITPVSGTTTTAGAISGGITSIATLDMRPITDIEHGTEWAHVVREASAGKWLVRVLRFGKSLNGWEWTKESGAALLPHLDHAPVGYYGYPNGYAAHMTDEAALAAKGVPMRNLVGDLSEPYVGADGVYAHLTVHEDASWLKQKFDGLSARGVIEKVIGLSVDTVAEVVGKAIKGIRELRSVDIVTAPSADGRFVRAVAGLQWPDLQTTSAPERHLGAAHMDEKEQKAAAEAAIREAEQARADAVKAKAEADADAAKTKAVRESIEADAAAIKTARAEMELAASDARVREAVSNSTLPEPVKAKLVKQMTGTVQTKEQIEARIKEDADAWSAIQKNAGVKGFGGGDVHIEMGVEDTDKMQAGLDRLFGHDRDMFHKVIENAPLSKSMAASVREAHKAADEAARGDAGLGFRSIREAYIAFTGDKALTGRVRMLRRLTEAAATTATWADALGNTLYRRLVAAYAEPVYNEQTISRFGSATDFRTKQVIHLRYFADLPQVAENAQYQEIALPSDEKVEYAVTKYGNLMPVTMETIINDDLRTVQEFVARLGRAARRTLAAAIWSPWINNSTWDVDANVWFKNSGNRSTASGGNTGSVVWGSGATLTNANEVLAKIQQLALMAEGTSGKLLGLPPLESLWLDAPLNMLGTARQLNMAKEFGTGNVNPILNFFGENNERINFCPLFTDTSNWGVHVDPRTGGRESVVCDFLQGRETPLFELQDMRTVGDVMLFDRITYKVSQVYGVDISDVYGATKNMHL